MSLKYNVYFKLKMCAQLEMTTYSKSQSLTSYLLQSSAVLLQGISYVIPLSCVVFMLSPLLLKLSHHPRVSLQGKEKEEVSMENVSEYVSYAIRIWR